MHGKSEKYKYCLLLQKKKINLHVKYTIYVNVVKIIPARLNKILKQDGWNAKKSQHKSGPATHVLKNVDHLIMWRILDLAPEKRSIMKNLEALSIAQLKPSF